jgi:hypothetical protein
MNGSHAEVAQAETTIGGASPSEDSTRILEAAAWTQDFAQADGERTSIETELGSVHSQSQSDRPDLKALSY